MSIMISNNPLVVFSKIVQSMNDYTCTKESLIFHLFKMSMN